MAGVLTLCTRVAAVSLLIAGPALADQVTGQKVFQAQCTICHAATQGGKKIGPSLFGVVGRTSGTLPGFAYSSAMTAKAVTWTPATLDTYLTAPRAFVPGTKMTFAGLGKPDQRGNVIEYLGTLK